MHGCETLAREARACALQASPPPSNTVVEEAVSTQGETEVASSDLLEKKASPEARIASMKEVPADEVAASRKMEDASERVESEPAEDAAGENVGETEDLPSTTATRVSTKEEGKAPPLPPTGIRPPPPPED